MSQVLDCYACDAPAEGTRDRSRDAEGEIVAACARHRDAEHLAQGARARVVFNRRSYCRPYRLETTVAFQNARGGAARKTRSYATLEAALGAAEVDPTFGGWDRYPGA